MKRLTLLTAFLCAFLLAVPAQAQDNGGAFKLGPRLTLDVADISDFYDGTVALGADVRYEPAEFPIGAGAAFDYYFAADNVTVYTVDINALYPIQTSATLEPYVGLGVGITSVSIDTNTQFGSAGGSDTGINIVGGAVFEVGALQPFAQGQFTIGDLTRFGITGGLLFSL